MINAGEFNKRVVIIHETETTTKTGFKQKAELIICRAWAKVNTTKGFTLVSNGSNFEDATTRLLIRKPSVELSRKYVVKFAGRRWRIKYINEIDHANKFVELQVEGITQNG